MRTSHLHLLALGGIAALATLGATAALADDARAPEQTPAFVSNMPRSAMRQDALEATRTATQEPEFAQETAPVLSRMADRNAVRAQTLAALKADQIPYGEAGGAGE